MSNTGYKIRNQEAIHFCTFTIVYWIDLFSRAVYRDILIESLKYCQKEKDLVVYAWVIMSNHVHLIIKSKTGKLSDTIRDFKSFTSKKIVEAIKTNPESRKDWILWMFERAASKHKRNIKYQMWSHDSHPEELESNKFLEQKLEYIHQNPVRACIIQNLENYLYSSAGAYADIPGLLTIEKIE